MTATKLLIAEPMHSGHHTNYILALVPALSVLIEAKVIQTPIIAITARHYKLLSDQGAIEQLGDTVRWDATLPETPPAPNMSDRRQLHDAMRRLVRAHAPDGFICTSADYDILSNALTNPFSRLSWPKKSVGIIHYGFPKGSLTLKENVKRIIYETAWKYSMWQSLLMVNPVVYENHFARSKSPALSRFRLLPDPVPKIRGVGTKEARSKLGLPTEGTIIGCVGMMDRRKAIPEFLSAFATAQFAPTVRAVLAGRIDDEYRKLIDTKYKEYLDSGRLILIDRLLSEEELMLGYAAMDLHMVLQYRRFNLSANVLKCVAHGKPFVCDKHGFSAMIAERFGAGVVCDVYDERSICGAMALGLLRTPPHSSHAASTRLVEFHSHENFANTALVAVIGPQVLAHLGPVLDGKHVYA